MSDAAAVAVCSRSFSSHPVLRAELLERFSDVRFNDEGRSLQGDDLVAFLTGRDRAITALERIDNAMLSRLPDLRLISKVGVGTDMIDFDAAARHGVEVRVHPGTNRRSVAELALAFALSLLRHVPTAAAELDAGLWRQPKGRELSGRTVGIVGFGHAGRDFAALLAPFRCELLIYDVRDVTADAAALGARPIDLEGLLAAADVVSLHVELNEHTRGIIDARRLALMKPDAVLINTSRGGLVDESALAEALRAGRPGAAGFDVFAVEPPLDRTLLELPNVLATPHIGGSTEQAVLAMGRAAIAGLSD